MKLFLLFFFFSLHSVTGNLFCNICRCYLRQIICREVNIEVVIRNSIVNEVEMKGVLHLDFKESLIPKWKWTIEKLPRIFPNLKSLDIRGLGLCLADRKKKSLEIQDDCSEEKGVTFSTLETGDDLTETGDDLTEAVTDAPTRGLSSDLATTSKPTQLIDTSPDIIRLLTSSIHPSKDQVTPPLTTILHSSDQVTTPPIPRLDNSDIDFSTSTENQATDSAPSTTTTLDDHAPNLSPKLQTIVKKPEKIGLETSPSPEIGTRSKFWAIWKIILLIIGILVFIAWVVIGIWVVNKWKNQGRNQDEAVEMDDLPHPQHHDPTPEDRLFGNNMDNMAYVTEHANDSFEFEVPNDFGLLVQEQKQKMLKILEDQKKTI